MRLAALALVVAAADGLAVARLSAPRVRGGPRACASAREELAVSIAESPGKGRGAFAAEAVPPNTWVCQYVGAPVTLLDTCRRYVDTEPEYLFQVTPDLYLDAQDSTHFSRFFTTRRTATSTSPSPSPSGASTSTPRGASTPARS